MMFALVCLVFVACLIYTLYFHPTHVAVMSERERENVRVYLHC